MEPGNTRIPGGKGNRVPVVIPSLKAVNSFRPSVPLQSGNSDITFRNCLVIDVGSLDPPPGYATGLRHVSIHLLL